MIYTQAFEPAFGKENVDCVFTSELDKHVVTTYFANFGDANIYRDIRQIATSKIPDYNILLADFPYQSFSVVGLKKASKSTPIFVQKMPLHIN